MQPLNITKDLLCCVYVILSLIRQHTSETGVTACLYNREYHHYSASNFPPNEFDQENETKSPSDACSAILKANLSPGTKQHRTKDTLQLGMYCR